MKRYSMVLLAGLMGLFVSTTAMGWVYGETVVYRDPVVVHERVCSPPVISYEPRVISETSYIGNDHFSIYSTRSRFAYEPVIERSCYDRAVVYERPRVVTRSYHIGFPTYVSPRYRSSYIVAPSPRSNIFIYKKPSYSRTKIKIKFDD